MFNHQLSDLFEIIGFNLSRLLCPQRFLDRSQVELHYFSGVPSGIKAHYTLLANGLFATEPPQFTVDYKFQSLHHSEVWFSSGTPRVLPILCLYLISGPIRNHKANYEKLLSSCLTSLHTILNAYPILPHHCVSDQSRIIRAGIYWLYVMLSYIY